MNVKISPLIVNLLISSNTRSKNSPWIIAAPETKNENTNKINICFFSNLNDFTITRLINPPLYRFLKIIKVNNFLFNSRDFHWKMFRSVLAYIRVIFLLKSQKKKENRRKARIELASHGPQPYVLPLNYNRHCIKLNWEFDIKSLLLR